MGSELDGLDCVDIPEPPEVLAESTAVFKQDGRLAVPRQGLTLAVEEGLSTHAEVEQERRSRLEVQEDPFSSRRHTVHPCMDCLLYTSDAADDLLCVDLGGRRIIKKKKKEKKK